MHILLSGYLPFDSDDDEALEDQLCRGSDDLLFDNESGWGPISEEAKSFVRSCLHSDPAARISVEQALRHPWLSRFTAVSMDASSRAQTTGPQLQDAFDVLKRLCIRRTFNGAIQAVVSLHNALI